MELVKKKNCDRDLKEGSLMMNIMVEKNNMYGIRVYDSVGKELQSGVSKYSNGEKLTVNLYPKIFQQVFEVSNAAAFEKGQCNDARRIATNGNATLIMPSSSTEQVIIK